MQEIWKPVKDFEDKYQISTFGRLKNIQTNHILKMTNQYGGYFAITLYNNKRKRTTRIHRIVAETFIPNVNNYKEVNHIDGNKQNNCVENLEWCDRKHNQNHALKIGLSNMNCLNNYNKNKCYKKYGLITQYNKNGDKIQSFYSVKIASKKTGVCARNILQCINNEPKRKTAGGYIWKCEKEVML